MLAVNWAFCKQDCFQKASHPVRVSFLVFVLSNIFNINSLSCQNVTKQFTIINLWPCFHVNNPSVMRYRVWISFYSVWGQPPRIFFLYLLINLFLWKLHWCFKFVRTKRSCIKLTLSACLFETSRRQKILERRNSPTEEVVVLKNFLCLSRNNFENPSIISTILLSNEISTICNLCLAARSPQ